MVDLEKATFTEIRDELDKRSMNYDTCLVSERFPNLSPERMKWTLRHDHRNGPTAKLRKAIRALTEGIAMVRKY